MRNLPSTLNLFFLVFHRVVVTMQNCRTFVLQEPAFHAERDQKEMRLETKTAKTQKLRQIRPWQNRMTQRCSHLIYVSRYLPNIVFVTLVRNVESFPSLYDDKWFDSLVVLKKGTSSMNCDGTSLSRFSCDTVDTKETKQSYF